MNGLSLYESLKWLNMVEDVALQKSSCSDEFTSAHLMWSTFLYNTLSRLFYSKLSPIITSMTFDSQVQTLLINLDTPQASANPFCEDGR